MNRRKLLIALFGGPLATGCLLAKDQGKGKGKGRNNEENQQGSDQGGDHDSRYFRHEDYAAVQRYYTGPRDLPPGLRKKYYRTGKLPPGWQKKIQPFPPELVRVLPPPPPKCDRCSFVSLSTCHLQERDHGIVELRVSIQDHIAIGVGFRKRTT